MPNKTISVANVDIWNRARVLAKQDGRSMSSLIEKLLREKLAEIEAKKRASIEAMEAAAGEDWEIDPTHPATGGGR